jgi:putative ATPase
MRGSDADAALHYLARMIEAGEDPRYIARRLIVHASEDVGMADPTALQTAIAAAQAVEFIGLPEAQLNLAQATIHIAMAPKSNAVARAIQAAAEDVRQGLAGPVPKHLRDTSYPGAARFGHGKGYRYPHDDPAGVLEQQYPPDTLIGKRYYEPTTHGAEARVAERSERIRAILRGAAEPGVAEPGVAEPGAAEPGAAEHGAEKPGAEEHGVGDHGSNEPADGNAEAGAADDAADG